VWLKLIRANHVLAGYCSTNGFDWIQVGGSINVADMDGLQSDYNSWTGNRQGLYAYGSSADFDLYIYRDAYSQILAECPANQFGTGVMINRYPPNAMNNINNNDWALYAGIEFGNNEYNKTCDSIKIVASSPRIGGIVEVYIDSIDVNTKIAECNITNTGSWTTYKAFTTRLLKSVSGNHDVYLKFTGSGSDDLFQVQSFQFITNSIPTSVEELHGNTEPKNFYLDQNYPNPFNPSTTICYTLSSPGTTTLKIYDLLGREIETLVNGYKTAGDYIINFSDFGVKQSSGIYFYTLKSGNFIQTKKMILMK
jgi:hypothetical protein